MAHFIKRVKNKSLNERTSLLVIAASILILWFLGQISFIGLVLVCGVAATMLIQLDIKHHTDRLKYRRNEVHRRRKTQQEVRSFRAQALNRLPSPVLLIGDDHKIIFANDEAIQTLNIGGVGQDAYLFLRLPALIEQIDRAISGKKTSEKPIRFTTASERVFDITVAPAPGENKRDSKQVMIFFYEVTSLLNTEKMRVDFVANASHELRTPLASLIGSIETLQGPAKDDPEAQGRFLSIMQRESDRMTRLIDDLLSLSRIELDRHKPPSDTINLSRVVENIMPTVDPVAASRDMSFEIRIPPNLPPVIADEDQIMQVLLNLLVNASKYADAGTNIHLSAYHQPEDKSVAISVRDEGPGIAPHHLARLTERFYRIDTARSRKMGGTGLGLAIVKHILLRHNSAMEIKSHPGQGTEFIFRLKTEI